MKEYCIIVKKYHKQADGRRTNYAILCNGAYIFYGNYTECKRRI